MSQNEKILSALQRGERLTPLDALKRFGCFRLSARIYDLREAHDIKTEMISDGVKHYAVYWMDTEAAA